MAKRKVRVLWRDTPEGLAAYTAKRAEAQARSDADGFDRILQCSDTFREWSYQVVPAKAYRRGHELTCETVMCSDLAKCQPGHGPTAHA